METAQSLSSAFEQSTSLERIQLSYCLYEDSVKRALVPGLSRCMSVREIDLSFNEFTDDDLNKLPIKIVRG